jgi:hypothetical protein
MMIRANASWGANRTYEKPVADILKEAEETDRREDGPFSWGRMSTLLENVARGRSCVHIGVDRRAQHLRTTSTAQR